MSFYNQMVEAIAVDKVNVIVLCPACGKLHWHDSGRDVCKFNYGLHASPCYVGTYEIITTPGTVRKKSGRIAPEDVQPRLPEIRRRNGLLPATDGIKRKRKRYRYPGGEEVIVGEVASEDGPKE